MEIVFYAIAFGLLQLAQNSSNERALTVLRTLNSSQDNLDLDKLVTNLRRAIVAEWTGLNSQEYRSFLTDSQLWSEAQRFLQRGVFSGELGDLVVTAAANAFQIPIVVFTSAASFPITTVMPTYKEAATAHPICVVLTQYDGGHYDAVIRAAPSESHEKLYGDSNQQSDYAPNCSCGRRNRGTKACLAPTLSLVTTHGAHATGPSVHVPISTNVRIVPMSLEKLWHLMFLKLREQEPTSQIKPLT